MLPIQPNAIDKIGQDFWNRLFDLLIRFLVGVCLLYPTLSAVQDCSKLPSLKARRLCREKEENDFWDDFPSSGDDLGLGSGYTTPSPFSESRGGPVTYTVMPSTAAPNLIYDSLPECANLTQLQISDEVECKNTTVPVPEVRWRDLMFEKMLPQLWSDFQTKIRFEQEVGGFQVDPFKIAGFPLEFSAGGLNFKGRMDNIQIFGASSIHLTETLVTRAEDLTDLDMKMVFSFDKILMNGTYSATVSSWLYSFSSEGVQNFNITMDSASISPRIKLDTTDKNRFGCGPDGSVLLTEIEAPITPTEMDIHLDNIGYGINTVANWLGLYILKTQEDDLVARVKDLAKDWVNSFMC